MWEELQKTSSLMHVASPLLIFRSQDGKALSEKWQLEKPYALRIYAFNIIPLGGHTIVVKRIDPVKREIVTKESGSLSKTWDHLLRVEKVDARTVKYTDEIEIQAGPLTVLVWMFAHVFYRHRQRRWRKLLSPDR